MANAPKSVEVSLGWVCRHVYIFYLQEESSPATGNVREEKTSCVTVSHMIELTATRHLVLLVRYEL